MIIGMNDTTDTKHSFPAPKSVKEKAIPTGVVSLAFPRSALEFMYEYATYKRTKASCKNKNGKKFDLSMR